MRRRQEERVQLHRAFPTQPTMGAPCHWRKWRGAAQGSRAGSPSPEEHGHKVHETSGGFEKAKWARLDHVAALDGNALLASRQEEAKAALVANHLPLVPTNLRLISWLLPAHVAAGARRSLRPCALQLLDEPRSHSCRDCGPSNSAISLTRPSVRDRAASWRNLPTLFRPNHDSLVLHQHMV